MPFRRDGSAEALVPLAVHVCCHTHVTAELNSFAQDVSKSHEVKGHGGTSLLSDLQGSKRSYTADEGFLCGLRADAAGSSVSGEGLLPES